MEQLLLVTSCDSPAGIGASLWTHNGLTNRGHRYYLDTLLVRKISKRHFLKDIENSFQEVTQIGPEPRHFFSFSNISTNRVARDFQNFGRNGP